MELIGRESELDFVRERLSTRRLVTLTGPGGIGKTSLARAAVRECAHNFELGYRTVDLARTAGDADLGMALAGQLGFASFEALIGSPLEQPVLLFIDNCEHVVDAAAEAIHELLESCEAPTVLATSRISLDLPGESLVVLGPLPQTASVQLFEMRARDVGTDVGDDQLDLVDEMCRRLDGVPLAIDLAAARTRSLTVTEMLSRFDDHLTLLSRPRFRGDPRHRSLRTTIEWSYELLPDELQSFFDRLGVFPGQFNVDMAHAVAGQPGTDIHETQDCLNALIDASLLVADNDGDTTRCRLLVALRALANERLEATDELNATWERYVELVVTDAEVAIEVGSGEWASGLLVDLLESFENLAAACRWCLDHDTAGDRAFTLVTVMWAVIHQAHAGEIEAIGAQALERWPNRESARWGEAAATVATAQSILGRLDDAEALADRASVGPALSSLAKVTLARVQGQISASKGRPTDALERFDQAATTARSAGMVGFAMESEVFAAAIRAELGEVDDARRQLRQITTEADRLGSDLSSIWARSADGYAQLRQDPEAAIAAMTDCLRDSRAMGYPAGVTMNLRSLALGHLLAGAVDNAVRTTLELLDEAAMRAGHEELYPALTVASQVLAAQAALLNGDIAEQLLATAGDLATSVREVQSVGLLMSSTNPIVPLPHIEGHALSTRIAMTRARSALRAVIATTPSAQENEPEPAALTPPSSTTESATDAAFARRGDMWEVQFKGRTALLRSTKGLEDIAELLNQAGREIHVLDLAGAGATEASTGDVVDAAARKQYEDRIRELQAEIEEAEANSDVGRSEKASDELDQIVDHLTSALGLGGKTRSATDSSERARSAVTQRIRSAIGKMDGALPALGRHLQASIRTGNYCSYAPEHSVRWQIKR